MTLNLNEFIIIGTFIISIIALIFSAFAFFRGRNIDLQNQLYLKKLDAYEAIIGEFQKVISLLQKSIEKINSLEYTNKPVGNLIELNKLSYQIDSEIDNSRNEIAKKSACFSKEFIEKILLKVDTLYGEINVNSLVNKQKVESELESHLKLQIDNFELLINQMREELGLDHFNRKLLKRVKKGDFRIDV